jgi:hypothetical protein
MIGCWKSLAHRKRHTCMPALAVDPISPIDPVDIYRLRGAIPMQLFYALLN